MNFKKFFVILLALTVVLSFVACKDDKEDKKECEGHVDVNDDYLCDKCGVNFDDGDEAPAVVVPKEYDITFVVKLDNGEPLSGIKFTLTRGAKSFALESDSNGIASQKLEAGPYAIEYDYETLPEYCVPDTFGFKLEEDTSTVELVIVNNTPDGTATKPFPVRENETEITLNAGEEIYFVYRGATTKKLTIAEEGITVSYNGTTYNAENGVVSLDFYPEIGKETLYSVKNNTDSLITTTMSLIAPLGSNENPIPLTESSSVASVSEEETVYYKWTADMDGVLVVTSNCENNNISLSKVIENDVLIISQTTGSKAAYLVIKTGEEVTIGVSAINTTDPIDVDFAIKAYAGTESDPVPVLTDNIYISLSPNQSIIFSSEVGKTLRINDEGLVSVWHDTITYTNEEANEIIIELLKPVFVLKNHNETVNGITIIFE